METSVALILHPVLDGLPGDGGQLGRARAGRMLGAVMPVWYLGSLALVAVRAVAGWHDDGTGLVVTVGALLILTVVVSVLLLVPINNRGKTWTPDDRPADWKQQMNRWDRLHHVRVAVLTAAFTLLAAALT